MTQLDLISELKNFGLNSYEAKLWTSLLSKGIAGAGELAELSNVPRSRAYDVLESLEKKGFIIIKIGKPIKYIPISPKDVIENFKKNIKQDSEVKLQKVDLIKDSDLFDELKDLHEQALENIDISNMSALIKGRNNLNNHLELSFKKAQDSIQIMTTNDGVLRKFQYFLNLFQKLKQRGVKIILSAPLIDINPDIISKLKTVCELNHIEKTMGRFVIIDNHEMILMTDDKKVNQKFDSGIWIQIPFFVSGISQLYSNFLKK